MTKKAQKTVWQQIKDVWADVWSQYKAQWVALWGKYKTIIVPFVQGTFAYIWQLVYGILECFAKGLYGTGKIILEWLIKIIEKA